MKVDRLVVLYEAGRDADKTGEGAGSANALAQHHIEKMGKLADKLAVAEGADSKAKGNGMTPAFVLGIEKRNSKLKYLKTDLGKIEDANKKGKKGTGDTPTWGAYIILHGADGKELRGKGPKAMADLLKEIAPKSWKLKKVCIVACTLGSMPDAQTDSYVRQFCHSLKVPDALVGGYTVPVYVGYENHVESRGSFGSTSFPNLSEEANRGRKLIHLKQKSTSGVQETAERLSDSFRATYKVAWRWNDEKRSSEQVDVMKEWYHQ
jgi:hypothetical protein